jgi:beta-galactosidase
MNRRCLAFLAVLLPVGPAWAADAPARERLSMDDGWRFHLGDPADVQPGTFDAVAGPTGAGARADDFDGQVAFAKARPDDFERDAELAQRRVDPVATNVGGDLPVVSATFDDAGWDAVQLPHDWAVALPFDKRGDLSHGYKRMGGALGNTIGWYRRAFDLPAADKRKALSIEFDGVYRNCLVWLNGQCLGRNVSGYTGFAYDIGSAAHYGGKNELVVRVDASQPEGWWYEGAGIYRHVWLVEETPVHIVPDQTAIATDVKPDGSAVVTVHATIQNLSPSRAKDRLSAVIEPPGYKLVWPPVLGAPGLPGQAADFDVPAGGEKAITLMIPVPKADIWSLDSPKLYTLLIGPAHGWPGNTDFIDFGIRTIRFDPDHGFFLNGKHVFLQGTCNHQDAAGVGVAIPDALNVWRLEQLKKFGCNAIRCSHNDPTPEVLDACDRLGILVMDEHRKTGRTPEILDQLERLVKRDRNHPSVILWSIGNEEQQIEGTPVGEAVGRAMKGAILKLDPTRPVTAAMDAGWGAGFSNVVDVQGFNYTLRTDVSRYHHDHPTVPLMASEEGSTISTRGVYTTDARTGYMSAYDVNAPWWATTAERWVTYFQRRPYMAGAFVWTGFDYRGEPTPYEWPCINCHFGLLDTCGFFKDEAYFYQSVWTDKPMVHLLPHWNWPGKEGEAIDVWAYTNGDAVELFKDGQSLGRQRVAPGTHTSWQVPYDPGTLVAKAYRNGAVVASDTVATTGRAAKVVLSVDRDVINADGADVAVVNVAVEDEQGRVVPTAGNLVHFKVEGSGHNLGVGNGDPSCHEPDKADQRSAFNGLCQLIVQSTGAPGPITVTATADGLAAATATVAAAPCPARPTVP